MSDDLLVMDPPVSVGLIRAETPEGMVAAASAIAKPLAALIEKQGLFNIIQKRRYVRCEGWTTLAAMLGCFPQEEAVTESEGIFIATVRFVSMKSNQTISRASAECGAPDEVDREGAPIWSTRPRYARRSMAITRATSKAARLAFSWIMALAGYEVTPAEEVPEHGFEAKPDTNPAASDAVHRETVAVAVKERTEKVEAGKAGQPWAFDSGKYGAKKDRKTGEITLGDEAKKKGRPWFITEVPTGYLEWWKGDLTNLVNNEGEPAKLRKWAADRLDICGAELARREVTVGIAEEPPNPADDPESDIPE